MIRGRAGLGRVTVASAIIVVMLTTWLFAGNAQSGCEIDRGGVTFDFAAMSERRFTKSLTGVQNCLDNPWRGAFSNRQNRVFMFPHSNGGTFCVSCKTRVRPSKSASGAVQIRLGRAEPHFHETPNRNSFVWCPFVPRDDRWYPALKTFEVRPGESHGFISLHAMKGCVEVRDLAVYEYQSGNGGHLFELVSPFCDALDGCFEISEGQVGALGFNWRNLVPSRRLDARNLKLCFRLPAFVEFLDATCIRPGTVRKRLLPDGGSETTFCCRTPGQTADGSPLSESDFPTSGSWTRSHYAILGGRGSVGTSGVGTITALYDDGKGVRDKVSWMVSFSIGSAIHVASPRRYANGLFVMNMFELTDSTAIDRLARTYRDIGATWLLPSARRGYPALETWRRLGFSTITPYAGNWCRNGYSLRSGSVPEKDSFVTDGTTFRIPPPEQRVCPLAIAEGCDYFRHVFVPFMAEFVRGTDGLWANWEPYMFSGHGCFCHRCLKEFAAFVGKDEEEVSRDWPKNVQKGGVYAKAGEEFRSRCHGKLVKALQQAVVAETGGSSSRVGFMPGVHFEQMSSLWRERNPLPEAREIHYADDLNWINAWGPYLAWDASKPYVKMRGRYVGHFVAAADIRRSVDSDYPLQRRPKLLMAPQGTAGTWLTQPENFSMALDCYFFNRLEAAAPWVFPVGGDARYLRAFAEATARAARYEKFVWEGVRCDERVVLEPVAEFACPVPEPIARMPKTRDVPQLQSTTYACEGTMAVAVFNFWQLAEAFFTLRVQVPVGRYRIISEDGVFWRSDRGDGTFDEIALSKGVNLCVGAARCRVFEIVPDGRGRREGALKSMLSKNVRAAYEVRKDELARLAAVERREVALETKGVQDDD